MNRHELGESFRDAEPRVRAMVGELTTVGIPPVMDSAKRVYEALEQGRFNIRFDARTNGLQTPTAFRLIKNPFHPLDYRPALIINPKSLPNTAKDAYGYKDAFLSDLARSVAVGGRYPHNGITNRRQTYTDFAIKAQLMMMEKYNVTELWADPRHMERQQFLQTVLGKAYWADMSIGDMQQVVIDALASESYTTDEKEQLKSLYQSVPHFLNVRENYTDYAYAIGISPKKDKNFKNFPARERARAFGWAVIEQITHRNRERLVA